MYIYSESEGNSVLLKTEFGDVVAEISFSDNIIGRVLAKASVKLLSYFTVDILAQIVSDEELDRWLKRFAMHVLRKESFMAIYVENKTKGEGLECTAAVFAGIADGSIVHIAAPREAVQINHVISLQRLKRLPDEAGPPRLLKEGEHPGDILLKWRSKTKEMERLEDEQRPKEKEPDAVEDVLWGEDDEPLSEYEPVSEYVTAERLEEIAEHLAPKPEKKSAAQLMRERLAKK